MSWLDRLGKRKEPDKRGPEKKGPDKKAGVVRTVPPVCSKCEKLIESLNVSIGDVLEQQGACVYSGSEGHLYEPLYEGSICLGCWMMLCDDCLEELVDKTRCPKCGDVLRTITESRLPKM
jgi:hypothetical protein